jgi:pimeloyl-ACP methyl ester carboxylesterase
LSARPLRSTPGTRGPSPAGRALLCILLALTAASPVLPAQEGDEIRPLVDDINKLVPRALEHRDDLLRDMPDMLALGLLKLEKANLALRDAYYGQAAAAECLREGRAVWQALAEGRAPELKTSGRLERAYLAPNDASPQPYILYVPPSYNAETPHGLFVFMHGWTPDLNKLNWKDQMYSPAFEVTAEETNCIGLMPFGRGNTDFQGAGEDDVMRAIDEVVARWNIDEDRIFLSGISMGGMGVWTIGAHHPQRFAALVPVASRGDFYMWKNVARGSLPAWKARLVDAEFGAELIPNYRNLPCILVHGEDDWVMPLRQSDRMDALLLEAGFDSTYLRIPEASHYTWDLLLNAPELLERLRTIRRQPDPLRVTFRIWSLRSPRAYWAEATAIGNWTQPAEVDCELDLAARELRVKTSNVTGLRLEPPGGEALTAALRTTWNGQAIEPGKDAEGRLLLGETSPPADGGLWKTPEVCGPISHAYADRFTIVYGGTEESASYKAAVRGAQYWLAYAQGFPQLASVAEMDEQRLAKTNLILFGTPEENELVARVMPYLPIKVQDGFYEIAGRRFDATRYGLCVVYPNPLAEGRYVVVNCGPVWGAGLPENHRYDMLPDFIIFDTQTVNDGTSSNRAVCAGFFDQRWQVSGASTWFADQGAGD